MSNKDNYLPNKLDHKLLRSIIFKLSLPSIISSLVLVLVVGIIWLNLFNKILAFGKSIDYAKLNLFGDQVSALIQHNNQYFWWAVCIVCSVIIIWILQSLVRKILNHARYKLVPADVFEQISQNLSAPALDVLLWAWPEQDEPLRLGDLILARSELQQGKSGRLKSAQIQRQALESARDQAANGISDLPQ